MSVPLPSEKFLENQMAHSLLHRQPVTVCQIMSFLGMPKFCTDGHSQLSQLCCAIQSVMLNVYHFPAFV